MSAEPAGLREARPIEIAGVHAVEDELNKAAPPGARAAPGVESDQPHPRLLEDRGTRVDAALVLVQAGHRVFPVNVRGQPGRLNKQPLTANGFHDASGDPGQVRAFWQRHPAAAIGLALPPGTVVVDLDTYRADYDPDHGLCLPLTVMQATGSGGCQLFYRTDGRPVRQRQGIRRGVDTRVGGSGFVVAWQPDVIASAPVESWAPAPDWVYESSTRTADVPIDDGPIPAGHRHDYYLAQAGRMAKIGLTPDMIEAALRAENARRSPDHDVEDLRAIARSSARWMEPHPVLIDVHTPPASADHPATSMAPAEALDGLRFYSPLELASLTTAEPDWRIRGFVAIGAITEIDGKIKAAGKTTLALHMARATLDATPFLGEQTGPGRVIYVTEQSRQTFIDALRRSGLDRRGDELRILFREDLNHVDWPTVVAACRQDGYEIVVFDTIGKLARIAEENAAGEWSRAMSPVQDLAASGRAVILCRHDRKGGGDVGDSGRGSSQASGDVDVILALRRPEGHQPGNRRIIESLSRFRETPEKIVVALEPPGYVLLGSAEAVAASEAREFVAAHLGREFGQKGPGLDMAALARLGEEHEPRLNRTVIQRAVERLLAEGSITRTGAGKRGDPYVYRPKEPDTVSAQTWNGIGGQKRIEAEPSRPVDLVAEARRIFADVPLEGPAS